MGNMKTITISQLARNGRKILDLIESGETLQISRNGRLVALLSPAIRKTAIRWKKANPLFLPGVSLSRAIIEERQGR